MRPVSASDRFIDHLAAALFRARRAVVLTGAGISTASGIPDFRSAASGLWAGCDPMAVASLVGFRRDPAPFYRWAAPLFRTITAALPNSGHRALADLEARGLIGTLITQNVDSLHQAAGSLAPIELHGSLRTMTCTHCFQTSPLVHATDDMAVLRCTRCGGVLKPDIILFGEELPHAALRAARKAAETTDLFIAIGSSLEVFPASELPLIARRAGASLWLINHTPTLLDVHADAVCRDDIETVLPALCQCLEAGAE